MTTLASVAIPRHPARWSQPVLDVCGGLIVGEAERLGRTVSLLDPYAGVGLPRLEGVCGDMLAEIVGVEIEAPWAAADPRTFVGDATNLPGSWTGRFDVVCSSCAYGSRMADHHEARDKCKTCGGGGTGPNGAPCKNCKGEGLSRRNTYRHALGQELKAKNTGQLQWGSAYRTEHLLAMHELLRVLRVGGLIVWNCSNHIRDDVEQLVAEWHLTAWLNLGCRIEQVKRVTTKRLRQGAHHDARVDGELVMVLRTPAVGGRLPLG